MANISRCIRYHARRTPDRPAMVYAGEVTSYARMWARIGAVAGLIAARGAQPGDRVAMLMKNSAAFVDVALAIGHAGAVVVPINFRLARDEIAYVLVNCGAVLLFADAEFANAGHAVPTVPVDTAAQADAALLAGGGGAAAMAQRRPDDLFRIMYTSGTTDRPKGVQHSHANFYAKSADQIAALGLGADTRLLVVGPLYHVGAFDLPGVGVLWAGGMLCVQREFDAEAALDLIAAWRLTGAWLAPVMTGALLDAQARSPRDTATLRWAIGGGARTPESRIRAFAAAFPNARYIDAYGLTETCGGDTFMEPGRELEKIGSVGRPISQVDVDIRGEDGRPLPPGIEGEVCLRGAKVTKGYWNAPEKTAASFFADWFRTGDVGYLDEDGFLFLTDRKKDMIISGGENIASSEVECAILELDEVDDVAVVGIADERWGERPAAFVTLKPGAALGPAEIRAHCRARLAAFKAPDHVFLEATLPRNASGKVLKAELRARLRGPAA